MVGEPKQGRGSFGVTFVIVLLLAALGMFALAVAGKPPADVWNWLRASREDGAWVATSFDRRSVAPHQFVISVRRGEVVGGYDDCNGWSYQDARPDRGVERMILSTLQECRRGALGRIYWILVHAPQVRLQTDDRMRLSRAGHEGEFKRCKPDRLSMRCVPVN